MRYLWVLLAVLGMMFFGGETWGSSCPDDPCPTFIRGDVDEDGDVDASDVFAFSSKCTVGSPPDYPEALDACDCNDDGTIDGDDGDYLAAYIYLSGPEPPDPSPSGETMCLDPTDDSLDADCWDPGSQVLSTTGTPIWSPLMGVGGCSFWDGNEHTAISSGQFSAEVYNDDTCADDDLCMVNRGWIRFYVSDTNVDPITLNMIASDSNQMQLDVEIDWASEITVTNSPCWDSYECLTEDENIITIYSNKGIRVWLKDSTPNVAAATFTDASAGTTFDSLTYSHVGDEHDCDVSPTSAKDDGSLSVTLSGSEVADEFCSEFDDDEDLWVYAVDIYASFSFDTEDNDDLVNENSEDWPEDAILLATFDKCDWISGCW